MIISREHRFVFVEAPFTGSTAISKELLEQYGCEEILHKHAHLREFLNQATPEERRYSVAIGVRNPLDQVVTFHAKLKSNHKGAFDDPARFEENGGWVSSVNREQFQFVTNSDGDFGAFLKRYHLNRGVRVSQYLWGRSCYDHLRRFEQLDESFHAFLGAVGLEPKRALPVTNPTAGRGREFYSAYPKELRRGVRFVLGPLVAGWGYDCPADWGGGTPLSSRVAYGFKNFAGRVSTQVFHLTPRHYGRTRAKLSKV